MYNLARNVLYEDNLRRNRRGLMRYQRLIIILALSLIVLVLVGWASADEMKLLEGLIPTVRGYCWDNNQILHPCVKYIKKGEVWFYLAILSADAKEVIYVFRVEGVAQTMVWQKGLRI